MNLSDCNNYRDEALMVLVITYSKDITRMENFLFN